MTNEEIQRHIEQNCRNAHGEPMMDEQAFYEGAKWMRDKALSLGDVVGRSEQLKDFLEWQQKKYIKPYDTSIYEQIKDYNESL